MNLTPILAVVAVWALIIILRAVFSRARMGGGSYRSIKAWLCQKYGLKFAKDSDPGSIRMQLQAVLEKERMRLQADYDSRPEYYEAERKKKRWRKPFNVDKRLAGFKAFIEKQDYSVLTE